MISQIGFGIWNFPVLPAHSQTPCVQVKEKTNVLELLFYYRLIPDGGRQKIRAVLEALRKNHKGT